MPPKSPLIRAALRLREVYLARSAKAIEQALLQRLAGYDHALETARALLQTTGNALQTGNLPAQRSLHVLLNMVRKAVKQTCQDLRRPSKSAPDLRSLVEELRQLEEEFDGLEIDLRQKVIRVSTAPIVLEDVYLGAFSIEFAWPRLAYRATSCCFTILALDPHPAARNDSVTHPHVRDAELCAGEAQAPIQRALAQGRIADAFCLVRSVLTHYNAGSPHIALENWESAVTCHDCERSCGEDELLYCESCGHDYCEECIGSCSACGNSRCGGCLECCSSCDAQFCSRCLRRLARCDEVYCRDCLRTCSRCGSEVPVDEVDDVELCPSCQTVADPAHPPDGDSQTPPYTSLEGRDEPSHAIPAVA